MKIIWVKYIILPCFFRWPSQSPDLNPTENVWDLQKFNRSTKTSGNFFNLLIIKADYLLLEENRFIFLCEKYTSFRFFFTSRSFLPKGSNIYVKFFFFLTLCSCNVN